MVEVLKPLLSQGTIAAVFISFMILALTYFTVWAKSLIELQLKAKDKRIEKLESSMDDIQNYIKKELQEIISDNQRVMQKVLNHLEK
jgi:hypothetical protein